MDRPARILEGSYAESSGPMRIRFASGADLKALEWEGEYAHYRRLFKRAIDEARHGRRILLLAEIKGRVMETVERLVREVSKRK